MDFFTRRWSRNNLTGNNSANFLVGNSKNDTLNGGNGDDKLYGRNGNDTLISGRGQDTCMVRVEMTPTNFLCGISTPVRCLIITL